MFGRKKRVQHTATKLCRSCGRPIVLAPFGLHYKWVTGGRAWKCNADPTRPVAAHQP